MVPSELPSPPRASFASDNASGAHPRVIEAVLEANAGHHLAYGDDPFTRRCGELFQEIFEAPVATLLAFNGTGANVLGLSTVLGPGEAVICSDWAHINVDETGAPERFLGAKLIDLVCPNGKLSPDQIDEVATQLGNQHHVQPGVVSLTQSTELGTLYSIDEIGALCERAHAHNMRVHLDGARLANAVAASGGISALRAMTIDAGVDILTFGGTKNGLLGAEAVIIADPSRWPAAPFLRKQATQLPSKMRFLAAQFIAVLSDGLWLDLAEHANAMAADLGRRCEGLHGVRLDTPPDVNSVFVCLPPEAIEPLRRWTFFWDWDTSRHQVRWMTSWDTTAEDLDIFVDGVSKILAQCN